VTVTWATVDDVLAALGPVADPLDPFLQSATDAANAFAFRRRLEAGYADDPVVSPGADVTTGVVLYAVALYRERGSVDSFASFDAFQTGVVPSSTFAQVMRLLAVPRAQIDRPSTTVASRAAWLRGVR
jgi:hypothetical protein